jgi:hypothetical protein
MRAGEVQNQAQNIKNAGVQQATGRAQEGDHPVNAGAAGVQWSTQQAEQQGYPANRGLQGAQDMTGQATDRARGEGQRMKQEVDQQPTTEQKKDVAKQGLRERFNNMKVSSEFLRCGRGDRLSDRSIG